MNISGKFLSKFIGVDKGSGLFNHVQKEDSKSTKQGTTKSFYAGDLNMNKQDLMAQKKSQAQKKALKTILDQHKQEKSLDDTVDGMKKDQKDLEKEYGSYQDQIKNINQQKKDLMESYGLTEETAKELGPDSEYQKRALDLDDNLDYYNKLADQAMKGIQSNTSAMHSIDLDRQKSNAMEDAVDDANSIMAAASKEAIGDMLGEVKENIDSKLEENKKKAEEAKEEKKEKEEKAEKAKKKDDVVQDTKHTETDNTKTDEILNIATDTDPENDSTLAELKKALYQTGILAEDATGIVVDKQI